MKFLINFLFKYLKSRFDISHINQLPDYMQICYKILLDTFEEFEEEMSKQGRLYNVDYLKEAV